jgi:hypothetical protein
MTFCVDTRTGRLLIEADNLTDAEAICAEEGWRLMGEAG